MNKQPMMENYVDIGYTIVRGNSIIMWECLDKVRDIWLDELMYLLLKWSTFVIIFLNRGNILNIYFGLIKRFLNFIITKFLLIVFIKRS